MLGSDKHQHVHHKVARGRLFVAGLPEDENKTNASTSTCLSFHIHPHVNVWSHFVACFQMKTTELKICVDEHVDLMDYT